MQARMASARAVTNANIDTLGSPVTSLRGVGSHLAKRLQRMGIVCIWDLLWHLPIRYEDRTRITPMGALRAGTTAVIQGVVELTQMRMGRRRSLLCRINDGTGVITLRFFHFT